MLDWNSEYRRVLQTLGFVIESFEFDVYVSSGPSLSLHQAVLEIIGALATRNDLAVLEAALDAMSKLSYDDEKIVYLTQKAVTNLVVISKYFFAVKLLMVK